MEPDVSNPDNSDTYFGEENPPADATLSDTFERPPADRLLAPPLPIAEVKVAYADMKLIRPLIDAIKHAGYVYATPVQAAVIPQAMKGTDVIGQAQTGTGKRPRS